MSDESNRWKARIEALGPVSAGTRACISFVALRLKLDVDVITRNAQQLAERRGDRKRLIADLAAAVASIERFIDDQIEGRGVERS